MYVQFCIFWKPEYLITVGTYISMKQGNAITCPQPTFSGDSAVCIWNNDKDD